MKTFARATQVDFMWFWEITSKKSPIIYLYHSLYTHFGNVKKITKITHETESISIELTENIHFIWEIKIKKKDSTHDILDKRNETVVFEIELKQLPNTWNRIETPVLHEYIQPVMQTHKWIARLPLCVPLLFLLFSFFLTICWCGFFLHTRILSLHGDIFVCLCVCRAQCLVLCGSHQIIKRTHTHTHTRTFTLVL